MESRRPFIVHESTPRSNYAEGCMSRKSLPAIREAADASRTLCFPVELLHENSPASADFKNHKFIAIRIYPGWFWQAPIQQANRMGADLDKPASRNEVPEILNADARIRMWARAAFPATSCLKGGGGGGVGGGVVSRGPAAGAIIRVDIDALPPHLGGNTRSSKGPFVANGRPRPKRRTVSSWRMGDSWINVPNLPPASWPRLPIGGQFDCPRVEDTVPIPLPGHPAAGSGVSPKRAATMRTVLHPPELPLSPRKTEPAIRTPGRISFERPTNCHAGLLFY